MRPASLLGCDCSTGSNSCLLRCGRTNAGFRGWCGDTCADEADTDSRCSSGHWLTAKIRRTRPRITGLQSSLSNGSSNLSMRSSGDLRPLKTMNAHCPATTARLIRNGQAHHAMLVSFRHTSSTVSLTPQQADKSLHDLFDANFRSAPVISRHAATHVALSDDADQHEG